MGQRIAVRVIREIRGRVFGGFPQANRRIPGILPAQSAIFPSFPAGTTIALSQPNAVPGRAFPVVLEEGKSKTLSLKGEVVEILEDHGQRLARISVSSSSMIDITGDSIREVHLGDRVQIDAQVIIECIRPE